MKHIHSRKKGNKRHDKIAQVAADSHHDCGGCHNRWADCQRTSLQHSKCSRRHTPPRISGWSYSNNRDWYRVSPNWWEEGANYYPEGDDSITLSGAKRSRGISSDAPIWGWNVFEQRWEAITTENFEDTFQTIAYKNGYAGYFQRQAIYPGWNLVVAPRTVDLGTLSLFRNEGASLDTGFDAGYWSTLTEEELEETSLLTYNCEARVGTLIAIHQNRSANNNYLWMPCHKTQQDRITTSGEGYLPLGQQTINAGDPLWIYWVGQSVEGDLYYSDQDPFQKAVAIIDSYPICEAEFSDFLIGFETTAPGGGC